MNNLKRFYSLKPWLDLSYKLKIERGGKCSKCSFTPTTKEEWSLLIAHHIIELTEDNINNPNISLNPSNIEIICLNCHNKEHHRFGHDKEVYIVYGSPLSGKSTYVKQIVKPGDLILDIDLLWQALSYQPQHIKPNNLRFNIFKLRDEILDQIKTRYGQWYNAYIIGGYPDKYERERLSQTLGAELIYIESTKEECLNRIENNRPSIWKDYIDKWWDTYNRTL